MSVRRLSPSTGPRTARTSRSHLFLSQTAAPDNRSVSVRAPQDFDLFFTHWVISHWWWPWASTHNNINKSPQIRNKKWMNLRNDHEKIIATCLIKAQYWSVHQTHPVVSCSANDWSAAPLNQQIFDWSLVQTGQDWQVWRMTQAEQAAAVCSHTDGTYMYIYTFILLFIYIYITHISVLGIRQMI